MDHRNPPTGIAHATQAIELTHIANSTNAVNPPGSFRAIEPSHQDHLFLLAIPSSCGQSNDAFCQEQPTQRDCRQFLNRRPEDWVRLLNSPRPIVLNLNARSENWVRLVESLVCGRPSSERSTRQLGSFRQPAPPAQPTGPDDRPVTVLSSMIGVVMDGVANDDVQHIVACNQEPMAASPSSRRYAAIILRRLAGVHP